MHLRVTANSTGGGLEEKTVFLLEELGTLALLTGARLFSSEERRSSLSLRMAAGVVGGALVLTLSIASWLQCRSHSLLAQIVHLTGKDFLASTTNLWVFPVQIPEGACMRHCHRL